MKSNIKKWLFLLSVFCVMSISSWGEPISVFVSIGPQRYLVEGIGGDRVVVEVLVPEGQNPETYSPSAAQIARLSDSAVFFTVGVPFENTLVPRLERSVPGLHIVHTTQYIALRDMEEHHHHDHDHSHECIHGKDPHTWLSPRLMLVQAFSIYNTLLDIDREGAAVYAEGFRRVSMDLTHLHIELAEMLHPAKGLLFVVFHPAFGYFAEEYGLQMKSIEQEGKEPTARQLAMLIDEMRAAEVRTIFIQPQFPRRAAQAIADAIGGRLLEIDPLAYDYLTNLRTMGRTIAEGLLGE